MDKQEKIKMRQAIKNRVNEEAVITSVISDFPHTAVEVEYKHTDGIIYKRGGFARLDKQDQHLGMWDTEFGCDVAFKRAMRKIVGEVFEAERKSINYSAKLRTLEKKALELQARS